MRIRWRGSLLAGGGLLSAAMACCISTGRMAKADDMEAARDIRQVLVSMNIDVNTVEIADGRANGGERALLITYRHLPSSKSDEQIGELVKVLEIGFVANKRYGSDLDSVAVTVGTPKGSPAALVAVKVSDIAEFMETRNAVKYMRTWTVTRFDPLFVSASAEAMGW